MSTVRQQGSEYQLSLFAEQEGFVRPGANGNGGTEAVACQEPQVLTASRPQRALASALMERVCETANLNRAYRKVKANKGAAGVDRMTVADLKPWIVQRKEELIASLRAGTYQPQPVRGVQIPKPGGGMRQLGIPTVVDRLVQQAILQVLEPLFDPTFSPHSYGFRPGRSAHQAVQQAAEYVAEGHVIVVDLDLEKFFGNMHFTKQTYVAIMVSQ